jgi:hypothetical protein
MKQVQHSTYVGRSHQLIGEDHAARQSRNLYLVHGRQRDLMNKDL